MPTTNLIFNFFIIISILSYSDGSLLKRYGEYRKHDELEWLVEDLMEKIKFDINCLILISDRYYDEAFTTEMFQRLSKVPIFKILVQDNEDLLSPNYNTLSVILQANRNGCGGYVIFISNGNQVIRFLRFGDRHRVIDTRARFILLYDTRLFQKSCNYLWKKIINVIFIHKLYGVNRYEFTTVPFPSPVIQGWKPVSVDSWKSGKFQKNYELFLDKTSNLNGEVVHIGVFEYMPSVLKQLSDNNQDELNENLHLELSGLEIQIIKSLSDAMNFQTIFYEPTNSEVEAWGRKQLNGSYTGLLGELISGRADIALGNFLYTPYNLKLFDLSIPYITQCFTFLTPESTTDNSRKTLILPFKGFLWLGVILTLVICTLVFYGLAMFHVNQGKDIISNEKTRYSVWKDLSKLWRDKKKTLLKKLSIQINDDLPSGLYLFTGIENSLMNALSMLLLVSLPKMPTGWSLRMFTGWWWLYCILVTVSYRASMTAILANPAQRVTIDTLDELASSSISCGGWGEQNKEFFTTSLDSAGQRVGHKFEILYDSNAAINRVAEGDLAYYDNIYFLHYSKVQQKFKTNSKNQTSGFSNLTDILGANKDLHIMGDCVINMPISLGLQKNSPLKTRVDKFLQRVIEAGLVKKWLLDVMLNTQVAESLLEKTDTKAVMDLKKFSGALVALAVGYGLGIILLIIENIHWYQVARKNPLFDKYKMDYYFTRRQHKKNP